jgi:hypothetical protein
MNPRESWRLDGPFAKSDKSLWGVGMMLKLPNRFVIASLESIAVIMDTFQHHIPRRFFLRFCAQCPSCRSEIKQISDGVSVQWST